MRHRLFLTFGLLAAVGLLAGCSNQSPGGSGIPSSGSGNSSSGSAGSSGSGGPSAPKVAHPLDASKFIKNPCLSLTVAQATAAADLGAPTPSRDDTAGQPACDYTGGGLIGVVWLINYKHGLSDAYAQQSTDAYFQPLSIDGYPAVLAASSDDRSQGDCILVVGASDQQVFSVDVETGPGVGAKSCTYAQNGAKAVIKNLGGNA